LFDPPSDQPQSVGDLIGRAFRVYRRNIPLFFKVLIGPTIFATVGALGLQWAITYGVSPESTHTISLPLLFGVIVCSLLIVAIAKWVLVVRQLAFVRIMAGFAGDYPTAYQFVAQRKWAVLALYFTGIALIAAVFVAWVLEVALTALLPRVGLAMALLTVVGVTVGIVGMIASICLIVLVGFLVFSAAACEDVSLNTLISRGVSLTMHDFGRSLAFGILLFIAITAISYPLTLPVVLLSLVDMFQQGLTSETIVESYRMPFYLMVVGQVWESLVNMLLWPVIFMAYGLFYYDLRLRQEGLDLTMRLDALQRPTA